MQIKKLLTSIKKGLTNDTKRKEMQFLCWYFICMVIAYAMSIINIFTGEKLTLIGTAVFGTLCLIKIILHLTVKKSQPIISTTLMIELLVLMGYFVFQGDPEGFSANWCILITFCALLLLGLKQGITYSFILWLLLVFAFWTPIGRALLPTTATGEQIYTETYKTRFPVIYFFSFLLSTFLEFLRYTTYKKFEESEKKHVYISMHDTLTGLYNRHAFNQMIEQMTDKVAKNGLSILILDIDKFKQINDTKGHLVGDIVLQELSSLIKANFDSSCLVSRWGGEEFAILTYSNENVVDKAEDFRETVENSIFDKENLKLKITISIGIASVPKNTVPNFIELFSIADQRLYRAKNEGRNKVIFEDDKNKI